MQQQLKRNTHETTPHWIETNNFSVSNKKKDIRKTKQLKTNIKPIPSQAHNSTQISHQTSDIIKNNYAHLTQKHFTN